MTPSLSTTEMKMNVTGRKELYKTTSHWNTNYDFSNDAAKTDKTIRGQRPDWSLNKAPYSSTRGIFTTEHESKFGQYGDKPRDLLPRTATAIPVSRAENM